MNTEDKMFELISRMYGEMQEGYKDVRERLDKLESGIIKTNLTIENEVNPKLSALFDGYQQNADKLDRIEKEVSKHDEIIWKRVK